LPGGGDAVGWITTPDLYTAITSQPSFWRVVQKLNGRRLVDIIVALLQLWIEGKIVLAGDPE